MWPLSTLVGVFLVVALASALTVYRLRAWAQRRHLHDLPEARRLHAAPTPRGGGIAIVALTVGGLLALTPWMDAGDRLAVRVIAACGMAIAAVSWMDDRRALGRHSIYLRLIVQVCCAIATTALLGPVDRVVLPVAGELTLGPIGPVIACLWIVGLTNAYNFMDGIDGLAGGQAVVAGTAWVAFGLAAGQVVPTLAGLLAAASGAGFLAHNWPPARIFMGDVGSAFLGYLFAAIAVAATSAVPSLAPVGFLVLWPFVFDSVFTFARRSLRGEDVLAPHVTHLYQRLVTSGVSQAQVTLAYLALAVLGAAVAARPGAGSSLADAAAVGMMCLAAAGLLWQVRSRERRRSSPAAAAVAGR
jgi:UDP-N-acetylmuramyl pentapeptide phosphotransferase/UDP-N-acetylglucosamine-1-phosphate transferase